MDLANLVGHSIQGKYIDNGNAYTYFMAGNGLWISASNAHVNATIPIADCEVRGLQPRNMFLALKHGLIPQRFWDLALSVFLASPEKEKYVGVRWNGDEYDLYYPEQDGSRARVKFEAGKDVVLEIHSGPHANAHFSGIDDEDEKGFKIYGVVDNSAVRYVDALPLRLRVGVYGYYFPVTWTEVFEGHLSGALDMTALEMKGGEK